MALWCRRLIAALLGTVVAITVPVLVVDRDASAAPAEGGLAASAVDPLAALRADQRAFLNAVTVAARTSQLRYGVPASVSIAQAVLETGWGTSMLARTASNYFGMTCGPAGGGPIAIGCRTGPDRFCDSSGCHGSSASFRVYRSMADSFADHGRLLSTNPRYQWAYAARSHPDTFIRRVAEAGYATDPQYAALLIRIMAKYRLYRHNRR